MTPAGTRLSAVWAVIVLVVIGLAAVDQFLARVESAEIRNTAQRSYVTGERLLAKGDAGQAIDSLRDAHALERSHPEYALRLIAALTTSGKASEAEPLLTDILQREPNDGRANLIAAHLAIQEGNTSDAESYYHRAIYGEWPGDATAPRVSARMELIDLLAGKNRKQELLAELISLDAASPGSDGVQKRLAQLFLVAGSPARAANVYESLVNKAPNDISAYEGLGDAELEQGRYAAAHEAFLKAFYRDPRNESVRMHLQTLNTVTGLDPTLRQLTSAEKYRRSVRILDMTRATLDRCAASNSDENRKLLKTADETIGGKAPLHVTNEAAEGVLSLAEKLWHVDRAACPAGPEDQSALDLIMNKLAS
jgi:tetratricopeptide (TPR) repeat protein